MSNKARKAAENHNHADEPRDPALVERAAERAGVKRPFIDYDTRYRLQEAELDVLRPLTPEDADRGLGHDYQRTLGDLIVDVLAPGLDAWVDSDDAPADWAPLEWLFGQYTMLELRALSRAMETGHPVAGEAAELSVKFTTLDASRLLTVITARMQGGLELAQRLRRARWGNPSFGGDATSKYARGTGGAS